MLFRKQNTGVEQDLRIRRFKNMHPIVFLPVFIAILIAISNCSKPKGTIVILENPDEKGFIMDLKDWTSKNKCELFLNKGDELQIQVAHESGQIDLAVTGKNGSEPYTGNDLKSCLFTVKVSETDNYRIWIIGNGATGKVIAKNVGSAVE